MFDQSIGDFNMVVEFALTDFISLFFEISNWFCDRSSQKFVIYFSSQNAVGSPLLLTLAILLPPFSFTFMMALPL